MVAIAASLGVSGSSSKNHTSPWRRRIVRTLAVIGGVWTMWIVYALVTPEAEDRLPTEMIVASGSLAEGVASPPVDLASAVGRILGSEPETGNAVELLVNGDEIFPAMLRAIREAQHTVNFLSYVYWTGEVADDFAGALADASERGVSVRVLLDAYGASKMDPVQVERMEDAGVEIAWFHPLAWHTVRRLNRRTHRKVLVVDDRIGFTGGVGIAEEWMGDARHEGEWRDNHFRVTGPSVRLLDGAFAENWLNATGEVLVPRSAPEGSQAGGSRVLTISTSPRGDMSPVAVTYWAALQAAEQTVDIATPYFVPDPALTEAIIEAAQRGVRVRLLVPGGQNDSKLVHWASFTRFNDLIDAGVQIFTFNPTMMHAKTLVADQRWSVIGSANFDNRSFELNDEIVLVVDDEKLATDIKTQFEIDLSRSTHMESAARDLGDRLRSVVGHVALLLREQL